MYFAIKITAGNGFDGTTELIAGQPPLGANPPKPGKDGLISIAVDDAGIIDPDVFGSSGANRNLLLQSYFLKFSGGAQDVRIAVVDDAGVVAFEIRPEANVASPVFSDRRWVVPLGYRILVEGGGGPATLRLNFWILDDARQLAAVTPFSSS